MSTHAHFTVAAEQECYEPRMTRAEAIARRDAGTLRENCVVVVTDGPAIGTAGNTSITEIELNPVSPTELGLTARVNTTFDNEAWAGTYDIDLGAAGSITELRDHFGNVVKDTDADSPTVHGQFPWHLSSDTLRDNYVEDSTLIGWDTLDPAVQVRDNHIRESTVDLTALPVPGSQVQRNTILQSTISHTGPGLFLMGNSRVEDGFVLTHTGSGAALIFGSYLHSHIAAPSDMLLNSAATTQINDSEIIAAPTLAAVENQGLGTGAMSISGSRLVLSRMFRAATNNTQSFSVEQSDVVSSTFTMAATATGILFASSFTANLAQITVNGGGFSGTGGKLYGSQIITNGTRAVGLHQTEVRNARITQNANGGTAGDNFVGCTVIGSSSITDAVLIQGDTDPGGPRSFNWSEINNGGRLVVDDSLGEVPTRVMIQGSRVSGHGTLVTLDPGNSFIDRSVFDASVDVHTGPFTHQAVSMIGGITKVLTASNFQTSAGFGFDNMV